MPLRSFQGTDQNILFQLLRVLVAARGSPEDARLGLSTYIYLRNPTSFFITSPTTISSLLLPTIYNPKRLSCPSLKNASSIYFTSVTNACTLLAPSSTFFHSNVNIAPSRSVGSTSYPRPTIATSLMRTSTTVSCPTVRVYTFHSLHKDDRFSTGYLGPLCNEPVPIPPGEDPNIRMERHLNHDCSVMTGKSKSKAARCARGKCGKVLVTPIKCDVRLSCS